MLINFNYCRINGIKILYKFLVRDTLNWTWFEK